MGILSSISDAVGGVSFGYAGGLFYAKEQEVKQGKNYVIASFPQALQISSFSNVFSYISNATLPRVPNFFAQVFCNVAPIISFPVMYAIGYIKQNGYERFAKDWNESPYLPGRLPDKLEPSTNECITTVCGFFAEHLGNLIAVAMVTSAVALMVLGQPFLGGGILAALAYTMIDQWGWVPFEISLFVETYMPIVQVLGVFLAGTPIALLAGLLMLPSFIFSAYKDWFHQGIDRLLHMIGFLDSPQLDELDAPLVKKLDMTFDEMKKIIDAHPDEYELNPAHFGKWAYDITQLPEDGNFDEYITLFNEISWEEQEYYKVIATNLAQDERFIDQILGNAFPSVDKAGLMAQAVDTYIPRLASLKGVSKEKFVADYIKEQMQFFVDIHMKRRIAIGSRQDVYDSIEWQKKILPILKTLKEKDRMQYEDALLTLAIVGGNYCARGQKSTSSTLFHDLLLSVEMDKTNLLQTEVYELKLCMALQNERYKIVQHFYNNLMKAMNIPESIKRDVHGFDMYRVFLTMGLYPLTEYERSAVGITELMLWEYYGAMGIRKMLYEHYETGRTHVVVERFGRLEEHVESHSSGIENAFKHVGDTLALSNYLRAMIQQSTHLSNQEKDNFEKIVGNESLDDPDNNWYFSNDDAYEASLQRLVLVMMGVMRRKKDDDAIQASRHSHSMSVIAYPGHVG
jgi:hypothetical protein